MDQRLPFLLINRVEDPEEEFDLFPIANNENRRVWMDLPHDFLFLYSNGKWGLMAKYEPGEEFGDRESFMVMLVCLEEARVIKTNVFALDQNGEPVFPQRVCTGTFRGNPSQNDYQIYLLEAPENAQRCCTLWISQFEEDPLGDGECLHENDQFNLANYINQNNRNLVWTRHQIGMRENFHDGFSLVYWKQSVYWVNETGGVDRFHLHSGRHKRYHLHPDVNFDDDGEGVGPRVCLATPTFGVVYIFTNAYQVWICKLVNVGNESGHGLVEPFQQESRIFGATIFVNRLQGAIWAEDLLLDLEDTISQGPIPHDCQIYYFETEEWQLRKRCDLAGCEGLWLLSENEHIGQYPLLHTTILNVLEQVGGPAQPAAAIAEEEEEEEEAAEEEEATEEEEDTTVIPRDEHIKCMERTIQSLEMNIKSKDILNRNLQDKIKELESQLVVERKLTRQHVDTKIAEYNFQQHALHKLIDEPSKGQEEEQNSSPAIERVGHQLSMEPSDINKPQFRRNSFATIPAASVLAPRRPSLTPSSSNMCVGGSNRKVSSILRRSLRKKVIIRPLLGQQAGKKSVTGLAGGVERSHLSIGCARRVLTDNGNGGGPNRVTTGRQLQLQLQCRDAERGWKLGPEV